MTVLIFFATLFFLLFIGVPIGLCLAGCAMVLMYTLGNVNLTLVAQTLVEGSNNLSLMAIPFFMLAGELMSNGGLSKRIVDFSNVIVGRFRGGLGYVAVIASIIFAGLSGSAVADTAALGGILLPLMARQGYNVDRSTGLVCSGAIIAPIIPPSIPMILLGTSVGLSVTKMFMSGLVPGLVLGVALMITWFFIVRKDGYQDITHYSFADGMKLIWQSIPALLLPVIIVVGIRMGVTTPTEAGVLAVVYAVFASKFIYKELTWKGFVASLEASASSTSTVMLIVGCASAAAWMLTVAQLPAQMASMLSGLIAHPNLLMLLINVFLFIVGMILDIVPNILIFGPILLPIIQAAGINEYYFALIMVLNLAIGQITPPVGTVLYVGSSVAKMPFHKVCVAILPFLAVEIAVLLLLTYVPGLVLVPLGWLT